MEAVAQYLLAQLVLACTCLLGVVGRRRLLLRLCVGMFGVLRRRCPLGRGCSSSGLPSFVAHLSGVGAAAAAACTFLGVESLKELLGFLLSSL